MDLSKKLSAALLEHQISELEARVQSVGLGAEAQRGPGKDRGTGVEKPIDPNADAVAAADASEVAEADAQSATSLEQQVDLDELKVTHAQVGDQALLPAPQAPRNGVAALKDIQGLGRIDDEPIDDRVEVMTHDDAPEPSEFMDEDEGGWRVVVLDASVMIWALRSVRRVVSKGWEVIVPLESESGTAF